MNLACFLSSFHPKRHTHWYYVCWIPIALVGAIWFKILLPSCWHFLYSACATALILMLSFHWYLHKATGKKKMVPPHGDVLSPRCVFFVVFVCPFNFSVPGVGSHCLCKPWTVFRGGFGNPSIYSTFVKRVVKVSQPKKTVETSTSYKQLISPKKAHGFSKALVFASNQNIPRPSRNNI